MTGEQRDRAIEVLEDEIRSIVETGDDTEETLLALDATIEFLRRVEDL